MKKILSVVIAISMLLGMMIPVGLTASAAAATECATWAEVVAAVEADSAASIKLTADVTADSTIASFAGTFDGNGKTVTVTTTMFTTAAEGSTFKNFTMNGTTTVSPFIMNAGAATEAAPITIEDVTSNVNVTSTSGTASAFIAMVAESISTYVVFDNCVNNGDLSTASQVGAFVGRSYNSPTTIKFTNCANYGDVVTPKDHAGGFVGCLEGGANTVIIEGCANYGYVQGKSEAGGFVGFVDGSGSSITINNSYSAGDLKNTTSDTATKYSASGFVGRLKTGASVSITNCLTNISTIETSNTNAAYFCFYCGGTSFTLTNCYYVDVNLGEKHTGAKELGEGYEMTAVTAEQLASGEVAYKLGEAWGQKLDLDTDAETAPVIGGEPVYQYPDGRYSNTPWGQGGTDEPDGTPFEKTVGDTYGTVTIAGPSIITLGTPATFTATFSSTNLFSGIMISLMSTNTDVANFSSTAPITYDITPAPSKDWEPYSSAYGNDYDTCVLLDESFENSASEVVVTFTLIPTAVGTTSIELSDNEVAVTNEVCLAFTDTNGDAHYLNDTVLNYSITVVDENGEGGDEGGDEPTDNVITNVNVIGYVEPTVGADIAENLASLSVPEGAPYAIIDACWINSNDEDLREGTFAAGDSYILYVLINFTDGYVLGETWTPLVNGDFDLVGYAGRGEETDDYDFFLYAVGAELPAEGGEGGEGGESTVIDTIVINGYVTPAVGESLADALANLSVPAGAPYSIIEAQWYNDTIYEMATEETFAENNAYRLCVTIALADGYTLAEEWTALFNDDASIYDFGYTVDGPECELLAWTISTDLTPYVEPDGTEENPFVIQNKDDVDAILVPAGETYYFIIDPFNYYDTVGEDFIGNLIKVIGAGATINGNATLDLPTNGRMGWPVHFSITAGTEDARAEIVVPKGTFNNPDSFDADGKAEVSLTSPKNDFEPYIFTFKADKNGILVVTAPDGTVVTINNLTSYSYGDMGVNTAEVVAGDEIQIIIATEGADAAGTVSVTIVPHLNIAVWTKNGDWVSADELAAMKADFIAYLENEFDIDTSVLGIEWAELTTDGNKVADLGALVNAGDFDIIVGCGNNVDSTAGVTIVKKDDINTDYVAAGRKVALLDENNALAEYLYDLLTYVAPVEIDKIDVSGITAPEYGKTVADYKASFVPVLPEGANYSVVMILWFELDPETMEGNGVLADDYVFDSSKTYGFGLGIEANDGYTFADGAVITANGGALELYASMAEGPEAALALVFNPAPDTGDNSAIAIFAIAAVATIGCVALALRKKKED